MLNVAFTMTKGISKCILFCTVIYVRDDDPFALPAEARKETDQEAETQIILHSLGLQTQLCPVG